MVISGWNATVSSAEETRYYNASRQSELMIGISHEVHDSLYLVSVCNFRLISGGNPTAI
jgi:hypothetical protein